MGDKAIARKTMQEAGVSIVPGTKDLIEDEEDARKIVTASAIRSSSKQLRAAAAKVCALWKVLPNC
jgi:hypothetical protein